MAGEEKSKRAIERLSATQQTTVEKLHTLVGQRGAPKALLAGMRGEPKVTKEDVLELQRLIREAKQRPSERGLFD